jgi:hypothetical protein
MAKADLTVQTLRERLHYDPETGVFTWLVNRGGAAKKGSRAGHLDRSGYRVIFTSAYGSLAEGRLAWLYTYGVWPSGQIDHIDGQPSNNRISNLRDVSIAGNLQNITRARKQNKSGFLGVTTCKTGGYVASIEHNRNKTYLGWFKTPEAAHAAYLDAKRKLHSTCTI